MIFNTFSYYFLFLIPSAAIFRCSPSPWRPVVLALSGMGFFIFFSLTAVGGQAGAFCLAILIWEALFSRLYRPNSIWCVVGIIQAVVILFVFKYWNFATGMMLGTGTGNPLRWAEAFLPLGLSFFTFEFIHYARDRRLNRTEAGSFWEYFAFILFFPTMVAGPIKRYQDFLPSLRNPSPYWANDWERGITRILAGLAKKFCIADVMTSLSVHLNATDVSTAERWVLPIWLLAFGIQIYLDFSGYSDIAIGSARLFGLNVKENFDWPYLQTNIAEFWGHWHMSLTRWLTDYIFIPLGGSRVASPRIVVNLLVTMLLSGLWHGAGLNFAVWGLWHGGALVIHRLWAKRHPAPSAPPSRIGRIGAWGLTFVTVNLGWAFFVMDLPTAILFFRRLLFG